MSANTQKLRTNQNSLAEKDPLLLYHRAVSALNGAGSEEALKPALQAVLSVMLDILGFPSGAIRVETGAGKIELSSEAESGQVGLCFAGLAAPGCACGDALERATPGLFITSEIDEASCAAAGVGTVALSPLMTHGRRAGLFFAAGDQGAAPSGQAVGLSNMIMENICQTLERVQGAKTEKQRTRDMETVNAIGGLITSKLKLEEMVREIVSTLGRVLETDEVNVILYDGAKRELSFLASYFADGSNLDRPEVYPLSDGINSWIIKNRRPLLMTHDTEAECARLGIRHGGKPAKSWLGAPMIYQDRVAGVLSVQSYGKTGLYDEESVALIEAVANQCAVAVENARLFEEVIEREAEKERLYFSLTHDLISLINPIAGFTKILKALPEGVGRESMENLTDSILTATDKITRFAEDILVYAKIKSGKLALDISRSDVLSAIGAAAHVYQPELAMRGIGLTVDGRPWAPDGGRALMADMDRAQMERVFINCVGNAVKHARSRIEVETHATDTKVTCRVIDDGDGVAADQCEALFEEYYQAGATKKGVGLGLPSVKKIIELHEGEIRIESDTGAGFMVEFSWPRTLADRPEPDGAEPSAL